MPIYVYECPECNVKFEREIPLDRFGEPQECETCCVEAQQVVAPVGFVLKGDGWPGKALRVKEQMAVKNRRLDGKMRDRPSPVKLAPNVGGERVDSWSEAKKLASSKGRDSDSYDPLIRQEQRGGA